MQTNDTSTVTRRRVALAAGLVALAFAVRFLIDTLPTTFQRGELTPQDMLALVLLTLLTLGAFFIGVPALAMVVEWVKNE